MPVPNPGVQTAALFAVTLSFYTVSHNHFSSWGFVGVVLWITLITLVVGAILINIPLYFWAFSANRSGLMIWLLKIHVFIMLGIIAVAIHPVFALYVASGFGVFLWRWFVLYRSGKSIGCRENSIVRCFFVHCTLLYKVIFALYMITCGILLWVLSQSA